MRLGAAKRRTTLGPFASAALPPIWKELARRGWNQADFARAIDTTAATACRILHGDRGAGRELARKIDEALGLRLGVRWEKRCPPNWKPHAYHALRPKPRAMGSGSLPDLESTGTDD